MEKNTLQGKVMKISTAIQKNKYIAAISGGLGSLMALAIVGSLFTLVTAIPIDAYQDFLVNIGVKEYLSIPFNLTMNLYSVYASFAIAYCLAEQFEEDGFTAGILGLMSFLIVTPLGVLEGGVEAIPFSWLGSTGLFVAMIVALVAARVYVLVLQRGIYIKMPNGVPPIIEKSFAALIPGIFITIIMIFVKAIFVNTSYGDIHTFMFNLIQTPLQNIGASFPALILFTVLMSLFWFCGIHGTMIVYSIVMPILLPSQLENLAAYEAGLPLPNQITLQCLSFGAIGGTGATFGLVVAMLFAKSQRYKTLGKLSILPSIFGINEPVIFGTPIVLNTKLLIPFIAAPTLTFILGYICTIIGIMPALNGVSIPSGTPIIITGFLMGGWQFAIFQVVSCVISYFIYVPFLKSLDNEAYKLEQETANVS